MKRHNPEFSCHSCGDGISDHPVGSEKSICECDMCGEYFCGPCTHDLATLTSLEGGQSFEWWSAHCFDCAMTKQLMELTGYCAVQAKLARIRDYVVDEFPDEDIKTMAALRLTQCSILAKRPELEQMFREVA